MRPGEEDSDAEDADEAQFGEGVDSDSEISELELAAMDRDDDDDDDDDVGEIEGDLESLAGLRALLGGLGRRVAAEAGYGGRRGLASGSACGECGQGLPRPSHREAT